MKSVALALRVRGGPTQGWGNIYRLCAFAEAFRKRRSGTPRFFVEGPSEVENWFRSRGHDVVMLEDGISLQDEQRVLAGQPRFDLFVMEMLECHRERQRLLRAHADHLVVFDDLLDHRYEAELVVCGQELPGYGNRSLSDPDTHFLLGYEYFLMPGHCHRALRSARKESEAIQRIVVSLGGGRYDLAWLKIASGLRHLDSRVELRFVLGPAADEGLRRELRELLPHATLLGGTDDLGQELRAADLAITSAGYTKIEAAFLGTPVISVSTQWHQLPLGEVFASRSGGIHLGAMACFSPRDVVVALAKLEDLESRQRLARRARALVDGRGMERVVQAVCELVAEPAPAAREVGA